MSKYEEGDTVYGKGGEEYEYVLFVPGTRGRPDKHLIRYEVPADYHEDAGVEVEETRPVVFAKCPEPTRSRRHVAFEASLRAERDELLKEVSGLRTDKEAMRKEKKTLTAQMERLRKLAPVLNRVEDFLDDKITHVVTWNEYGAPKISTLAEAVEETDQWSRKAWKLLSLYGDSKGDLSWGISRYSDGSGSRIHAHPCTSLEQAIEVADGRISEMVDSSNDYSLDVAMKWADANGRPFPDDVRAKVIAQQRVALLNNERAAAAKHNKAQGALEGFDARHEKQATPDPSASA